MTSGPLRLRPKPEAPATGYVDRPEEILAALPAPRQSYEYFAQRWESEGGLVHQLD
jgi:anti-sigma factor ChrR (cupin superfamily)